MKPDRPNFDNIYISYNSECTKQGKEFAKKKVHFLHLFDKMEWVQKAFFQKFPLRVRLGH